ncbi:uncharacterized protein LOC125946975 [Dermacentor silvarum]|uniref:uncharacterized protein LOC125946975 n=1 Tax=Dermacentor silvarum TaxID=543639 RepID=UPI0021009FEE|nr:uncharacterized protein LOC125946975 [Dermacentor silvarum]
MESSEAWRALNKASFGAGTSGWFEHRTNWRQELIVKCSGNATSEDNQQVTDNIDSYFNVFLFDIFSDPCELNNLASSEPELRDRLLSKLVTYRNHIPFRCVSDDVDLRGFPEHHQCTWPPWIGVKPARYQRCPC